MPVAFAPELPRLTRSLRAFTSLEDPALKRLPRPDLHADLQRARELRRKRELSGLRWDEVRRRASDVGGGQTAEALWRIARELTSQEPQEVAEEAALLLLRMFLPVDMALHAHAEELRHKFGAVSYTKACTIFEVVQSLSDYLDEPTRALILGGNPEPNREPFGGHIVFVPIDSVRYDVGADILPLLRDLTLDTRAQLIDNFQVAYHGSIIEDAAQKSVHSKNPQFGTKWLRGELAKYHDSSSSGITVDELVDSVAGRLKQDKSNDALQDELFDLLGFDRFKLIQTLLQHRGDIVHSLSLPSRQDLPKLEPKRPTISSQVVVQMDYEKLIQKQARKEEKKLVRALARASAESSDEEPEINMAEIRAQRTQAPAQPQIHFNKLAKKKLNDTVDYPHVYDLQREVKQTAGFISGVKMMLPIGVEKIDKKTYEEVTIPLSDPVPTGVGDRKVKTSTLNEIGRIAFEGVKELNRIQSVVFPTAYTTNENLLICAPTGAGKTNVALLAVVHQIEAHAEGGVINKNAFKIVYVAPMKALAAEMTRSFGQRLSALGLSVRELTGDMQLTKKEILETQMLVTTPEKWDVVTRKGTGDVALTNLVKLLIIDEVHLLHGDRGPVVEALVARTLRQVETSQSMIRIVGLSATLPNYLDVARFLRVNPHIGLFHFDSRFRPVPLSQTFVGVKATKMLQQMSDMDDVCFEKVLEQVQKGHQVMVFVHARNATVRVANVLKELASQKNQLQAFEPENSSAFALAKKNQAGRMRNKQVADLFQFGFSCHHAGMLRSDRTAVEKLFGDGLIKVLVCTSTLAWGVNLPAHAVIIRGTEIYDSKHGAFVDLSILDVLQIFGRAGRPQFDKSGHGTIITTHDKLTHYLSLLTNQFPIESNFINCLTDNLNAEITLGTISNVAEAVEWLSYTYLFVRMRMNPQVYGINYQDLQDDPQLAIKRRELIHAVAKALDKARMIRYNERTGDLSVTDLGRTASHFYIKYSTVEVFNEMLHPIMDDGEVLAMVAHAQEFEQLKVRDDEMDELDRLTHDYCELPVAGGSENLHGKVNILLQTYLSRGQLESFSLISDQSYIIQNAVRIVRSLFDIALRKNNAIMTSRFLALSKCFELQMWEFQTPLRQFPSIKMDTIDKIEEKGLKLYQLIDMEPREVGAFLHSPKLGPFVQRYAQEVPHLEVSAVLQPITRTVLRIRLTLTACFPWNDRVHGKSAEHFWVWIEDPETNHIYHHEYFLITKRQVIRREPQELVVTIPLIEPLPSQYYVRVVNDRWLGSDCREPLSFQHLILPETHPPHTDLLPLQPLPVTALKDPALQELYSFTHFNPIQTQIFHCLYHTDTNMLLGAPTGSGKTIAAELAMFRVFREYPKSKVVYIAPLKALVRERISDWKVRLEKKLGRRVVELTGDVAPDIRAISAAHVIVTTPEKWDGISRSWQTRRYVQDVALIVIDEIHLLGEDRGPVLEVIVSRTNFISAHTTRKLRVVGLSTALANAKDLANWLGIRELGLYNFRPSVRPVPLEVHISGFPGKHYCPRMATMNRPAFQAIRQYSPAQPALIFVSSRRQTRLTALDLIAFLAAEEDQKQWLHMSEADADQVVAGVKDQNLKLTLAFGIGMHHAGLTERDRLTVEELFVNQKIQLLITTATLAWGVNFPAHLVVIKGTEYYDGKLKRYVDMPITDVLQMMGRAGRPQFDDHGVAVVFVQDIKKNFYKKFLYEPFPVESSLLEVLPDHLNAEIVAGTIRSTQQALDYLTWTYLFRRLMQNPTYYNLQSVEPAAVNAYLSQLVENAVRTLQDACCLEMLEDDRSVEATSMGRTASYYYLGHQTMRHLRDSLHPAMTVEDVLRTLAHAHEYSQIPVRHNEDLLNGELSKRCPLPVNENALDSSHTKTQLLFQAHFSHLQLPCADYYTDLKSVLDQAIRIMQAIVDVSAEQGWLASCLQAQIVVQMIVQAQWADVSPLLQLPHIQPHHVVLFRRASYHSLPAILHGARDDYQALYAVLKGELDASEIEEVYKVLNEMPIIDLELSLQEPSGVTTLPKKANRLHWVQVHSGVEMTLSVRMKRLGRAPAGLRAYAPGLARGADETWFLSLGNVEQRELMALKRVSGLRNSATHALTFTLPQPGRHIVTLYLMSACYLGLDQQLSIHFEATPPPPDPQEEPSSYELFPQNGSSVANNPSDSQAGSSFRYGNIGDFKK